jgi:hypothetical protein
LRIGEVEPAGGIFERAATGCPIRQPVRRVWRCENGEPRAGIVGKGELEGAVDEQLL